jgi:subtilisin family serine protease
MPVHKAPLLAWATTATAVAVVAAAGAVAVLRGGGPSPPEARDWMLCGIGLLLGARIASHAPRNACGWLLLLVGVSATVTIAGSLAHGGIVEQLREVTWWPSYGLIVLILLLFPDGRLGSRWWRAVGVGMITMLVLGSAALVSLAARAGTDLLTGTQISPGWDVYGFLAASVALVLGAGLAVLRLVLRVRSAITADRGPLVWAAAAAVLFLVALVLDAVQNVPFAWVGATVALPAAAAIGVLRYGLYDIDVLVHRSLLNGLLAVAVIAIYVTTVQIATQTVPGIAAPLAAAAAVLLVAPLRHRLSSLIESRLYGQSSKPYELVADLSRRVGGALTASEVLGSVVVSVADGLNLPYAAIYLAGGRAAEAQHGARKPWDVTSLPLAHRGQPLGELLVQQRAPDEPWARREKVLLEDLAGVS